MRAEAAFEYAARLGYDGVELMVWAESVSQDIAAVKKLSRRYRVPVLSVHAPCLLISQRVWGANPIPKLDRSVRAAEQLGAQTVVVHPPFTAGAPMVPFLASNSATEIGRVPGLSVSECGPVMVCRLSIGSDSDQLPDLQHYARTAP